MKNEDYRNFLIESTEHLTAKEIHFFTQAYSALKKQNWIAYLLWFIGGAFGFHRLYVRDFKGAIILSIITIVTCGIGAIVGFIDVMNVPKLTNKANKAIVLPIIKEIKKL